MTFFGLVALLGGLGCSTGYNRGALDSALQSANPRYVTSDLSLEEIDALEPQLSLPAVIAVTPPIRAYDDPILRTRNDRTNSWDAEELATIEALESDLRDAGVARELVVLPDSLIGPCEAGDRACQMEVQRKAAARVHADALLVLNVGTSLDRYANPMALLYLTIVGAYLVPGTHTDALTVVEGVLLDNRNEYLYAFARGEGEQQEMGPIVLSDPQEIAQDSRKAALEEFRSKFAFEAAQLR